MDALSFADYLAREGYHPQALARPVDDPRVLALIARKLDKWDELRPFLKLDSADEDAIKRNYLTAERQRFGLLEKWKERYGTKATYSELAKACYEADRCKLVDEVCSIGKDHYVDQSEQDELRDRESSKWFRWYPLLVVLLAITLPYLYPWLVYKWNEALSPSLPVRPHLFFGREKDIEAVTQYLDFSSDDIRSVCIVGGPGIGKSTLAVRAGYEMLWMSMVIYVDMAEVSSMVGLSGKVLEADTGIVYVRRVTLQRLYKWARDRSHNTLVILDNCDDILHREYEELQKTLKRILDISSVIKILMTSRQWILQVNQFELYQLSELTTESSCALLWKVVAQISPYECQEIANLTGHVPLALRAVGALLRMPSSPDTTTVIAMLKKRTLNTLCHSGSSSDDCINASISLSYHYLSSKLKKLGRILSHFPGSFDETAVQSMFKCHVDEHLQELVQRSLLQYDGHTNRYHLHHLIRKFFIDVHSRRKNQDKETRLFLLHFQLYYIQILDQGMTQRFAKTSAILDTEKHNFKHLVETIIRDAHTYSPRKRWKLLKKLQEPVRNKAFVLCHVPEREMYDLLVGLLSRLEPTDKHTFEVFLYFLIESSVFNAQTRGFEEAAKELAAYEKQILKFAISLSDQYTKKLVHYYTVLTLYYNKLEDYQKVLKYHEVILTLLDGLPCTPGQCAFADIGYTYFSEFHDFKKSAQCFELALKQEELNILYKATVMIKLYYAYYEIGDVVQCKKNEEELIEMLPSLMAVTTSEILNHQQKVTEITNFLRSLSRICEANHLDGRLLKVMKTNGKRFEVERLAHLYDQSEVYVMAVEMALLALNMTHSSQNTTIVEDISMWFVAGRALYKCGRFSEGLDCVSYAYDLSLEHNLTQAFSKEIQKSCLYLIQRGRLLCLPEVLVIYFTEEFVWPWIPLTLVDKMFPESKNTKPNIRTGYEQSLEFSTTLFLHKQDLMSSIAITAKIEGIFFWAIDTLKAMLFSSVTLFIVRTSLKIFILCLNGGLYLFSICFCCCCCKCIIRCVCCFYSCCCCCCCVTK